MTLSLKKYSQKHEHRFQLDEAGLPSWQFQGVETNVYSGNLFGNMDIPMQLWLSFSWIS
jgi:hypothetical protein